MICIKLLCQLVTCLLALQLAYAYPQERDVANPRLSTDTEIDLELPLNNLYSYQRTLSRLRRALAELEYEEEEAAHDMELAEINVFRPLFRYRAEVARQVKNSRRQQQFG